MIRVLLCLLALALAGCETAQERQQRLALSLDKQDDEYCLKQIGPTTPDPTIAYNECRHALMTARAGLGAGDATR